VQFICEPGLWARLTQDLPKKSSKIVSWGEPTLRNRGLDGIGIGHHTMELEPSMIRTKAV